MPVRFTVREVRKETKFLRFLTKHQQTQNTKRLSNTVNLLRLHVRYFVQNRDI
jgi:hypothetical protein